MVKYFMRLSIGLFATVFVTNFCWADQIKGHVLNTIRDDEGLKVIVESNESLKKGINNKKKTYSLYMSGQNSSFAENEALLATAKEKKQTVSFDTKKDGLTIIESLKVEK